jgi:hypothetical protein
VRWNLQGEFTRKRGLVGGLRVRRRYTFAFRDFWGNDFGGLVETISTLDGVYFCEMKVYFSQYFIFGS